MKKNEEILSDANVMESDWEDLFIKYLLQEYLKELSSEEEESNKVDDQRAVSEAPEAPPPR